MVRVPRRLSQESPASLSAIERHLLECIDGELDEEALSFMCGRSLLEVDALLERLVVAGLVSFGPTAPTPAPRPPVMTPGDGVELADEARAEIDRLFARVGKEDHYQLLGIERSAAPEEVRAAYYRVAPRFHPDRHFRKKLGAYKPKIEAVFAAFTKAYETLRISSRRGAYDAGLQGVRPSSPGPSPSPRPPEFSRAPTPTPPVVVATPPKVEPEHRPTPTPASAVDAHARREQLRRKLSPTPVVPVVLPPAPAATVPSATSAVAEGSGAASGYASVAGVQPSAAEILRTRFQQAGDDVRERRLRRYVESAEDAMNLGDYRTAAAAFAQASKLVPEDVELARRAAQAAKLAGVG